MAIITISRLTGSGGREIATAVAEAMGFMFIDGNVQDSAIDLDNVVILGNGSQFRLEKAPTALHVQIVAPLPYRVARIMRLAKVDRMAAEQMIQERDEAKEQDPAHYDLVINLEGFGNEAAVRIIVRAAKAKGIEARAVDLPPQLLEQILSANLDAVQLGGSEPDDRKMPAFAHSSEREFARVMDFYRIRWEYEPRTFPIEWDEEHNVVAAFTPDFYLPDLDLYIELTTMKQSLVTKKNRKVRRLRELHPEINIKILYERDYRNLIWKYGLSEPEAEENGSIRKIG